MIMSRILLAAISSALLCSASALAQSKYYLHDADTLSLPVRLAYIDAPEKSQTCLRLTQKADGGDNGQRCWPCGRAAQRALDAIMQYYDGRRPGSVTILGTDRYGRLIAQLKTSRGDDVALRLIAEGWAEPAYMEDAPPELVERYTTAFRQARHASAGLHSSQWQKPSEYRKNPRKLCMTAR
jgi:endonuclease YncB( thermonuclease family)